MRQFQIKAVRGEGFFATSRSDLFARSGIDTKPLTLCRAQLAAQKNLKPKSGAALHPTGLPWLTLVLGSGCLEPRGDSAIDLAQRLVQEVHTHLWRHPDVARGGARLAARFTASMTVDRLGVEAAPVDLEEPDDEETSGDAAAEGTIGPPPPEPLVGAATAELAYVAALVTALFHALQAQSVAALRRYGDAEATYLQLGSGHLDLDLGGISDIRDLTSLARGRIDAIRGNGALVADDRPDETIREVLEHIDAGLAHLDGNRQGAPQVTALDLQLLTDLTWFKLTERTLHYPGWADLLLQLSAQAEIETRFHGPPRPVIKQIYAPERTLKQRYLSVTREAWDLRVRGGRAEGDAALEARTDFFDAAARVVSAQAVMRREGRYGVVYAPGDVPDQVQHPVASIFVTTFDLELEMALLARRQPFAVVMPVHTFRPGLGPDEMDASLSWLGCVVDAPPADAPLHDDDLERLFRPLRWFPVHTLEDDPSVADLPVVVRLNGCPLIDLPTPADVSYDHLRSALAELQLLEPG
ncbi:MAG TPA: hypothetical protein VGO60_10075, partial [Iamia sp.]|nr:hypothetical protein [Iamia sp.]